MLLEALPEHVQAGAVPAAAGQHGRCPGRVRRLEQAQRAGQLAGRGAGVEFVRAVRLVHGDDVGELQDALLDALELVAGAGQGEQQEAVDHARDGGLGLADADGLHQHHVVAGRLHHHHRLAGGTGHPAERARGGRGADERGRVDGELLHPGLVAQDGAARAAGGRVDGEHRDPVAEAGEHGAERLDEGGLAHPRHPGDADPHRVARVRQQLDQQPLGERPVVGPGGLHQGDGPRDVRARAVPHPLDVLFQINRPGHRRQRLTARGRGRRPAFAAGRTRRPGSPCPAGRRRRRRPRTGRRSPAGG